MCEEVFRSIVMQNPAYTRLITRIDSCGLSIYQSPGCADPRVHGTLLRHDIHHFHPNMRQIGEEDFIFFDIIFAVDFESLKSLKDYVGDRNYCVILDCFGKYSGTGFDEEIKVPYDGGMVEFDYAFAQSVRFSFNFLMTRFPGL